MIMAATKYDVELNKWPWVRKVVHFSRFLLVVHVVVDGPGCCRWCGLLYMVRVVVDGAGCCRWCGLLMSPLLF